MKRINNTVNVTRLFLRMMNYDNPALREHMEVKCNWTPEFTSELFHEMKKFLYLCATHEDVLAPPDDIDEMWQNFVLFTGDYDNYCKNRVGMFLHYQPLAVIQRAQSDGSMIRTMIRNTLFAVHLVFGDDDLSKHWSFKKIAGNCGPCVCCGASISNCQG